jgi:enoyl-CoA hydratase/carnithine racemase
MTEVLHVSRDAPRAGCWRFVLDDAAHANALSPALVGRMREALREAFAQDARTIVFEAAGGRFCGGFDLRDVDVARDDDLRERFMDIERLLEAVRRAPALTIALVRGPALGAGADLVAACDYRIGTKAARFAFPGGRFGVVLGTRHLAGLVGRTAALSALIEGQTFDAEAALGCGLLTELRDEASAAARVDEIVRRGEALDIDTLRAMLWLIRDVPSERDASELAASVARPGLADRIRAHARRVQEDRSARRAPAR